MARSHTSRKFRSAQIVLKRVPSQRDAQLAQAVATFEFRMRWGPTIAAWLCIVLGFAFALISRSPETGEYVMAVGDVLSFKGAFGGLLVAIGAVIVWLSRPSICLVFEGDKGTALEAKPTDQ